MKLVLLEQASGRPHGVTGAMNHLGIEVLTTEEVSDATLRLRGEGLATEVEELTNCCYAVQNKVWVNDPDGAPWEVYTVVADAPAGSTLNGDATCCVPETVQGVAGDADALTTPVACC